jgi:hypothetical protein
MEKDTELFDKDPGGSNREIAPVKRNYFAPVLAAIGFYALGWDSYSIIAGAISIYFIYNLILSLGNYIAFREFIMVLFSVNFLLSPALIYNGLEQYQFYPMYLKAPEYFMCAIPCILLMYAGIYSIKTKLFEIDFSIVTSSIQANSHILKQWVLVGIFFYILKGFVPAEVSFFLYLLSSIRYVGAFGLFAIDRKKYKWYSLSVLAFEAYIAFSQAMFHDMLMWAIFFGLLWAFLFKPGMAQKLIMMGVGVIVFFFIQTNKSDYRNSIREKEDMVNTVEESVKTETQNPEFFSTENVAAAITRINQGWILSSVINNMQVQRNYQGLDLLSMYAESAILPRFLAPDKLRAGDKTIFNKFSGQHIRPDTSMGLGIFADGYVSFGYWGMLVFAFLFGFIFSSIFRMVEGWTEISPFFMFLVFPILNYAIRPDCETQTILGHIVKSLIVMTFLTRYYRTQFKKANKADEPMPQANYSLS